MTRKNETWREQVLEVPAKVMFDVVFNGTKPNYFMVNNLSVNDIYLGIKTIPSPQVYEMAIPSLGENITARAEGSTRIMLFNNGTNPARIILTTFEDDFNPAVLAGSSTSVVSGGGSGGGSSDGIIRGFNVALPAGSNKIGSVDINSMPPMNLSLNELPQGANKIGKVDVASLPVLPSGSNNIGNVGVVGGVTIDSMPAMKFDGELNISDTEFSIAGKTDYYSGSLTVDTTERKIELDMEVSTFKYITNDGSSQIMISFGDVATNGAAGKNGVIPLNAGETISELNIKATTINLRRAVGSGLVRFLGV